MSTPQWGGLQEVRRIPNSTKQRAAYIARQNEIRSVDPFMYDAELEATEGTSATGIGGDPTARLPDRIAGSPQEVRPDYRKYGDQAESNARQAELQRTLREIDQKAESMRPGSTRPGQMSDVTEIMDAANREKFSKMLQGSEEMARKAHAAKYGLPSPGEISFNGRGFGGVGRI